MRGYSKLQKYDYEVDTNPVDMWSIVHLGFGVAAGLVGFPFLLTLAGAMFWEAFENWRRPRRTIDALPDWTPEINVNALIDVVAAMAGWGIGAGLSGMQ